jgi:hypothetical protein
MFWSQQCFPPPRPMFLFRLLDKLGPSLSRIEHGAHGAQRLALLCVGVPGYENMVGLYLRRQWDPGIQSSDDISPLYVCSRTSQTLRRGECQDMGRCQNMGRKVTGLWAEQGLDLEPLEYKKEGNHDGGVSKKKISEHKLRLSPPLLLCSSTSRHFLLFFLKTFLAVLPQILQFSPILCNPPVLVSKYLLILSVANKNRTSVTSQ